MAQAGHQNAHALDWVRGELDETLKQAVQSLEFFVENTGDEYELTACTESLNQVIGTLRLVELDAAVHYTQAMVELLEAVREDRVERSETIFEALMRGLLQLPAYLEYIQSGGADMIQALLPEINELRQLWGQKALGPEQFFDVALDVEPPAPTQPPAAPLAELAAKARPTYQKALVAWLRNPQDPNALRVLLRVCELVRQAAPGAEIARLWWAAGGLFEGLGAGAIPADGEAKQLLTALDRELKKHAEQGEVDAADAALTRRLLYRVGQAVDAGPLSRELDAAFGLAGRVPSAELVEEVGRRLHGPDTTVLRSVGQAVKEDFNRARDIIEIFGASSEPNPADLGPLQDNLGRMADTLGMMGLNDLADAVREQRNAVQQMADGSLVADEPRVVDVAEVLLHVDTFLKELADESQRALRVTDVVAPVPTIGANTDGIAQPRLTDLESRQVARALYGVGLQELEQVRNSVIAEEESSAPLADQPPRLIALAGGMHMLGHEQAAVQLGQLAGVVEEATHEPLEGSRLEMLADAITGLESTLEAYRADQSASRYLEVADERLAELMGFIQAAESAAFDELAEGETAVDFDLDSAAGATAQEAPVDLGLEEDLETPAPDMDIDAPMEAAVEEVEPAPEDAVEAIEVAEAEPEPEPESEPEVLAEPEPELEAEPAVAESAEAPLHPVLSEEYDAETLDIFLEEADEVVGMLQEQVPQWIANPSDGELLGWSARC
jgi:chemosensory pili system protein ChpA (sensor histidine kinase/response regulator)